jgi:hypothetical protein
MVPESQRPSSDVLVWEAAPKFFQPTIVPADTETVDGWKGEVDDLHLGYGLRRRGLLRIGGREPASIKADATAHANSTRLLLTFRSFLDGLLPHLLADSMACRPRSIGVHRRVESLALEPVSGAAC